MRKINGRIPRVLKITRQTNHAFWLARAACQRDIALSTRSVIIKLMNIQPNRVIRAISCESGMSIDYEFTLFRVGM